MSFAADFRDMFEVRGTERAARAATCCRPRSRRDSVLLRYAGLDGVLRASTITFSEPPDRLSAGAGRVPDQARAPRLAAKIFIEVGAGRRRAAIARHASAPPPPGRASASVPPGGAARTVRSSGRLFNEWLDKSRADLALLTTELPTGPYPYAGIPWFSTAFGRDAIITALQMLWLDPALARGVLRFLAAHQATETSPFQRRGARQDHARDPQGRDGGAARAAVRPLLRRRRHHAAVRDAGRRLCAPAPATSASSTSCGRRLCAATAWIEGDGDANGDGFVDYARGAATGLANQGWKDSEDSVFHADGRDAVGPIALVEVQGYVYAALRAMADLAARRGETADGRTLAGAGAERLRAAVEARFWMEELGLLRARARRRRAALPRARLQRRASAVRRPAVAPSAAERGRRRSCWQRPSTPAGASARSAAGEPRYNPMSYHNGSVWPHDTALCAAGIARYGARDGVVRLLSGTFEAAVQFDMRLPELFCGFARAAGEPPIAYPVACLPQAWASGAVFMLLQACLGLSIDGWGGEIHVDRPRLPIGIDRLTIRRLAVGSAMVDLTFQRVGDRVAAFAEGQDPSPVPLLLHS